MFDKLKSLFIADDEEFTRKVTGKSIPKEEPKLADQSAVKGTKEKMTTSSSIPTDSSNVKKGKVSDKFTNILFAAIEKADQEGFDYLEFRNSLASLRKMDMDEATRFKSAYAMAQTMDATPGQLISSANHYLSVLAQEEQKFGSALVNQRERQIGDKKQELEKVSQAIRSKAEQIKRLSAEIEQHQQQLATLEKEVQQAAGKVENTQRNFVASYQAIVSQIQGDVEKMKQYLK